MGLLGTIGVFVGIAIIIFLSAKGVHITIAAPVATLVILLMNDMDIMGTMLGSEPSNFMGSLGNYVTNYFAIFLLGSILAKLMETSGATVSIADTILSKIGEDNPFLVMVAIFVISVILTYGGISLFVAMFAVIPLARPLFKKMDISWHLIQLPVWLGIATITMTMLPGTPAIQNVIPMQYLGTTLTAAAIPSILASIGAVAFGLIYMKITLERSIAKGDTYATYITEDGEEVEEQDLPAFLPSIIPLLVVVVMAISGSVFGNEYIQANIIYFALLLGILLSIVLFYNYIPDIGKALSQGGLGSIGPIFATALAVAFGAVVMGAPGFQTISDAILKIPGGPLVSLTVLTALMSGITGSSSGALGIVMPAYAEHYLAAGLAPELIHRVAAIGSNILTVPPHGGAMITFLSIAGLNHKNGFKEGFIIVTGSAIVAQTIMVVVGGLMF